MSADCPFRGLTCDTEAEHQQHVRVCPPRPKPADHDLDDQLKDAWNRYDAVRLELRDLTLRQIAETVTSLVPEAASLHLGIRYPDNAGDADRWLYRHLCDAAGAQLVLATTAEEELEDSLHDLLADLADLADVTDTGRVDLARTPPTLTGDDPPELLAGAH